MLIVDDHPLMREAVIAAFRSVDESAVFIQAENPAQGLETLAATACDIVLFDLGYGGLDGLDFLSQFRRRWPVVPVVVYTGDYDARRLNKAMDLGASGIVSKTRGAEQLVTAVRAVLDGAMYVAPEIKDLLDAPVTSNDFSKEKMESLGFTSQQAEVLSFICQGQSNKEIANKMKLSETTIKKHVTRIFQKIGVTSRAQAIVALRGLAMNGGGNSL